MQQSKSLQTIKEYETKLDNYSPMYQYFNSLTVSEFEKKVESGVTFTAYIGRSTCSDCSVFEPSFIDLITQEKLTNKMDYVNLKWLYDSGKDNVNKIKEKYQFTETPAFITFKDGKVVDLIEWSDKGLPISELKAWFIKHQVID